MPIYFPNVPLPDAYRELIAHANLPDAEVADLLNDAHATCATHGGLPIIVVWHDQALCRECVAERYGIRQTA
jgi:hypothetical protein